MGHAVHMVSVKTMNTMMLKDNMVYSDSGLSGVFFWALRVVRVLFHCVDTLTLRNTRDCMFAIFSLTSYRSHSKITIHVRMFNSKEHTITTLPNSM